MSRTGHVKRFFSANGKSWIDVLRLDQITLIGNMINGIRGQRVTLDIKWEDRDGEALEQTRTYEQIMVEPPVGMTEVYPDAQAVPINRIKTITFFNSGQRLTWSFDHSSTNTGRQTYGSRVYSRGQEYIVSYLGWEQYKTFFETIPANQIQFVETEIADAVLQLQSGQRITFALDNSEVKTFIGDYRLVGDTSKNRLDPFQYIVNVSWGEESEDELPYPLQYVVVTSVGTSTYVISDDNVSYLGVDARNYYESWFYGPDVWVPPYLPYVWERLDWGLATVRGGSEGDGFHLIAIGTNGEDWEYVVTNRSYSGTVITVTISRRYEGGGDVFDRTIDVDVAEIGFNWLIDYFPYYPVSYINNADIASSPVLKIEWRPST